MKKIICFIVFFILCFYVFGFDNSLNGSWGLFSDSEIVNFNINEITFAGIIYRANQIRIINENIIIVNMNGVLSLIQFYFLETDKLLFIHSRSDGSNPRIFILRRL